MKHTKKYLIFVGLGIVTFAIIALNMSVMADVEIVNVNTGSNALTYLDSDFYTVNHSVNFSRLTFNQTASSSDVNSNDLDIQSE